MKAFVIKEKGLVLPKEIEEPVMGLRDVLIEVRLIGLCGSDLNSYRGEMPLVTLPRVPGHEIGGVIVKRGREVPEQYRLSDLVTVSPYTDCGICPACRSGRPNTCEFNQTLGVQREGALTERIAVPFEKVYLSRTLSLRELVLIEPMSVGYHGANRGQVSEADTVLILGCGTIGMGALMASTRKGATVIAVDIDDSKLEQAKKFGAAHCVNSSKQDLKKIISELTKGEGVSVVIEAAGTQATYQLAVEAVCFSGRIVFIGYPKGKVSLEGPLLVRKEVNIYGSRNALRVFPSVIAMFELREKPYTDLISRVYPFAESAEAFRYWDQNTGAVSKILIEVKP